MHENEVGKVIVDAAFKVHTTLGPGLLESVYREVLKYELEKRALHVEREVGIPVVYEEVRLDIGFKADLINCWSSHHRVEIGRADAPRLRQTAVNVSPPHRQAPRLPDQFQRASHQGRHRTGCQRP